MSYYIGVDLGGTNVAAALVDENCKIISRAECKTDLPRPEVLVENDIAMLCNQLLANNNLTKNDIAWIGIGTPGSVNATTGIVGFNANFGYHNWQLKTNIEKLTDITVYIENDANAAAYGEYMAGALKNADTAIAITLGTGIGGGIIIDGKLYSGCNNAGGEIGHIVMQMDGRPCSCGRCGCYEKYAAASALTQDTRDAMQTDKDTMMWEIVSGDINKVNAKTAFDGMRMGDKTAEKLVAQYIKYVACGLVNIINTFQPEILCIGGGPSKEGDALLEPLKKYIDKEEYARDGAKRTKVVIARLYNDAGLVGAAMLGKQYK